MSPHPAVLAVDGGGSKIDVALVARSGGVLGAARSRLSIYDGLRSGLEAADTAVKTACIDAGIDPDDRPLADVGVFCLAGADLPVEERRIVRAAQRQHWAGENVVKNDTFAVLRAGSERGWGVAVVCGSGLNCSGVAPNGRTVRFPALGALSGDRVSGGGWLGMEALGASIRAGDGRGPRTQLQRMVPAHFRMRSARAVMEAVHLGNLDEELLRELAPVVFEAAGRGDAVATRMVEEQADEIVVWAAAAIRRLRMQKLDVDVVVGGGVLLGGGEAFLDRIRSGLEPVAPRSRLTALLAPPVVGAAMMGLDRVDARAEANRRLRADLTHERLSSQTQPTGRE